MRTRKITKMIFLSAAIVLSMIFVFPTNANAATKKCAVPGCGTSVQSGSAYCKYHTCKHKNCTKKVVKGGNYCSDHTCKYDGCYSCAYYTSGKYKGYCTNHAWVVSGKKPSSSSSSGKKTSSNSSSSNQYDMPDCDDYESYEEFMDDWDGDMPDGSDAEDYWENW